MAGYMTVLTHNVYDGRFVNGTGAPVANGTLLVQDATGAKLVMPTKDATTKILCRNKTTLYDTVDAYEFVMNSAAKLYYLVENEFDINNAAEYDTSKYTTPDGAVLRAHPIHEGETWVATAGELTAGTEYGVLATGLVGSAS